MTTCAEAQQAESWTTGGYISWPAVHEFLRLEYVRMGPMEKRVRARLASILLDCLEMLFGSDILAPESYPSARFAFPESARFSDEDLLALLTWVIEGQEQGPAPGEPPLFSGDEGWWFTTTGGVRDRRHWLPGSADSWAVLRRNRTGLEALADRGVAPLSLEHKLLSSGLVVPGGGGLVGLTQWIRALEEAGAMPGAGNLPSPPGLPGPLLLQGFSNFWGEVIGAVFLIQLLSDTASTLGAGFGQTVPPLTGGGLGMGASLTDAFSKWQQRRNPAVVNQLGGGLTFRTPGPLWRIAVAASSNAPAVMGYAGWVQGGGPFNPILLPAPAQPYAGQDWDSSLHQASRATLSLYHMNAGLSPTDRLLLIVRLSQWGHSLAGAPLQPCSAFAPGPCPPDWSMAPDFWVPRETDLFFPGRTCSAENVTTPLLLARVTQAPDLVDILTACLIVVRGGLFTGQSVSQPITSFLRGVVEKCLVLTAGQYRGQVNGEVAGWCQVDTAQPSDTSTPADLVGTRAAIALLLLTDGHVFPGVANTGSLPVPDRALVGLDSFLHVFGGRVAGLVASNPWNDAHVPG